MKILLVEDNERVAGFLVKGLREGGHTVDHADNGRDGLFLASSESYDAIIMDRVLPGGVEGLAIVEALRKTGNKTPILILSALGEVDDRIRGLRAGGDDYLAKPFAFGELVARLDALVRRSRDSGPETVLIVGDLRMDPSSHTVTRAGKPIQLQPREFRLLEFLMRVRGAGGDSYDVAGERLGLPFRSTDERHRFTCQQAPAQDRCRIRPAAVTHRAGRWIQARDNMPGLTRSTAVRLAVGYAVLFIISSLLLTGFLWWRPALYLDREIDAVILADGQAIADRLRDFGLPGAIETINDRVGRAGDEHAIYLLVDPTLSPVAGNLQAWPLAVRSVPGWHDINLERDGKLHVTRALFALLPGGFRLLVGRDVQDRVEIRALIVDSLVWASLGASVLAIVGGLLMRRAVLGRVETINRTASAIVMGDFSRRVPTQGSSDEFDQLARTINAMLEQIEHLIEGVRNASNVVAHDLRTPLAELRARLETLMHARPPMEETYDEIRNSVTDIDRIVDIFNALLRLAEIDSGVRRAGFREVDLVPVTTDLVELYEPAAEEKGIALAVEVPERVIIRGDPNLLAQAIGNLVDNAIKYAPRHGKISLTIAPTNEGHVEIAVADNGPGIADAEKSRAVDRFYRGDRGAATEGIGLGLSVVEAVARLHAGRLSLMDNCPGLVATLSLPWCREDP